MNHNDIKAIGKAMLAYPDMHNALRLALEVFEPISTSVPNGQQAIDEIRAVLAAAY
jgi:hypothetical protein